ncbi:MAG: peptide-methionine (S)-S-oxide reductase [Hyphomicrobiales bacterium]|nr:MAG: peptide-methionine (S)-S-oxide reductase [Hyphomicrobiales bacterium]
MNFSRLARVAGMTILAGAAALGLWHSTTGAAEEPVVIPAPAIDLPQSGDTATAIFAGGCFWGVQGVFQHVKGVKNAVSGYAGGSADTARYDVIGGGQTGHAETVEITYDPSQVSYGQLLQIFFSVAMNPTQLNFQGPDHGTQYRNAIFFQSEEEKAVAAAYIAQLDSAKVYPAPIVTTLETFEAFYPAEQYHQDFLTLNPTYPYIVINDIPKVAALQVLFPAVWREEPVLVGTL